MKCSIDHWEIDLIQLNISKVRKDPTWYISCTLSFSMVRIDRFNWTKTSWLNKIEQINVPFHILLRIHLEQINTLVWKVFINEFERDLKERTSSITQSFILLEQFEEDHWTICLSGWILSINQLKWKVIYIIWQDLIKIDQLKDLIFHQVQILSNDLINSYR